MQQFSCKKQKQQLGVHFLLFKHLLLFGFGKKQLVLVHCYETRDKRSMSTGQVLLGWAGGAGQNPPQYWALPIDKIIPWKQRFLPQGYPGQKGCSARGMVLGLRALPAVPLMVQLFRAAWRVQRLGCLPLAGASCQQCRALYWFTVVAFLGSCTQLNVEN